MLCRNSLLIAQEAVQEVSEVMGKGQPWSHIVRSGHSIPANAARKVLTTALEKTDHILESAISMLPAVIHAAYILYIHTIRHPDARMASIDKVLIDNALAQLTSCAHNTHDPTGISSALAKFKDLITRAPSTSTRPHHTRDPTRSPSAEITPSAATVHMGRRPSELFDIWNVDDAGWSPDLPDQIGWDWAAFAQLFPLSDGSMIDGGASV
ncbi:hypothetical protein N0V86_005195 [Didymella sp. IMI 355093]|nr:hypothetical protein N0V86_005195 [Didymella sp. IMI 355093]